MNPARHTSLNASLTQRSRQARGRKPCATSVPRCGMTTVSIPAPRAIASPPASAEFRDHDRDLRSELPSSIAATSARRLDPCPEISTASRGTEPFSTVLTPAGTGLVIPAAQASALLIAGGSQCRTSTSASADCFFPCREPKCSEKTALPRPKDYRGFCSSSTRSRTVSGAADFYCVMATLASGRGPDGNRTLSRLIQWVSTTHAER